MADVMVAVMPFAGHVTPMLGTVQAFIAAGHTVRVYTGRAYAARFADAGAGVVLWNRATDFDENNLRASFPRLIGRKGSRQMLRNVEELFIGTAAGQCADLAAAYANRPWDVLVADNMSIGAQLVSEKLRCPWATVAVVPLAIPDGRLPPPGLGIRPMHGPLGRLRDAALRLLARVATRGHQARYLRQRADAGLPERADAGLPERADAGLPQRADAGLPERVDAGLPERVDAGLPQRAVVRFEDAWYSPDLVCASGVPELDWPRTKLPEQVVFVGELVRGIAVRDLPHWFGELDPLEGRQRPTVYVTQGTQNVDPHDLIEPAFTALGELPVTLVATTGQSGLPSLPFPAPANARIAGLLPYPRLLPLVDVMITNGGWGAVLSALAHGIPLIVAGGDLDKPEVAARVAASGAGINLRTGTPDAKAVLDAWHRLSSDPRFRQNAKRIQSSLAAHDGPAEVVAHTMALLERRRAQRRT